MALVLVLLSPAAAHGQGSDESDLGVAVLKEARALAGRGELEEALEKTTRALSFARAEHGAYDALVGFILDDLATLNYRLGRLEDALGHAEQALTVLQSARGSDSTGYALVASNLASILTALDRPEEASPLYRDALPVLERNLGRAHTRTAATARNLATVRRALGDAAGAADAYAIAIDAWQELEPEGRTAARLMVDRAEVLLRLGRVEDAAEQAESARSILEAIEPPPVAAIAEADLVLADVDLHALRPLEAQDRLLEAARLLAVSGSEAESAQAVRVQSRLASLDLLMGYPAAAGERLVAILDAERRRRGPGHPALGVLHRRLGEARLATGEPEAARRELEQALDLAKDDAERALATVLLALTVLEADEFDRVVRLLEGAQPSAPRQLGVLERGSPAGLARLVRAAPPPLGRRLLEHFEMVADGAGSVCRQARALTALALVRRAEGAYPAAEDALERAIAMIGGTLCPNDTALEAALALADFRLADGMAKAALDLIRAGLDGQPASVLSRPVLERTLDLLAGARTGTPEQTGLDLMLRIAQQVWQREKQAVDDALARALIESGRAGADRLLERRRRAGLLQARLRLAHGPAPFDEIEGHELQAASSEDFKPDLRRLDELDRAIRRASPELARLLPFPLERTEIQAALGADEALLLQVTGARSSHLFLVRNDTIRYAQTSLTRAELEAWVEAALGEIAAPEDAFDSFALHAVYTGLVSPFADALDDIDHLIVLADGAARRLPFGVLVAQPAEPVPPGGDFAPLEFLIERAAVSTVIDPAAVAATRPPSRAPIAFAGFAAPVSAEEPAPDPGRAARVQAITASLSADKALLDLQAAKSGFAALDLDRYRILALALPVARDAAGLPALAFVPGAPGADRLLEIEELVRLDLDADLVMLLDDDAPASAEEPEPSELLPALALAGVRAVVTTYWAIGPDPVSRIAGPVVEAVLENPAVVPGRVLRDTVLPLVEDEGGPAAAHPSFWAPFGASLGAR